MGLRKPITTYTMTSQVSTTGATGSSGPIVLRDFDYSDIVFQLSASAMSGTNPTLDVYIQTSPDYGATWYDMIRLPRLTASGANPSWGVASVGGNSSIGAVGAATISSTGGGIGVPLLSNTVQVYWALGGTSPSASFTVNALLNDSSRGAE
jgi:hypothetical protein